MEVERREDGGERRREGRRAKDRGTRENERTLFSARLAAAYRPPQRVSHDSSSHRSATACYAGCAALHALLARQSGFITTEVLQQGGVRLLCRAMRTFRTDSAAAMQARGGRARDGHTAMACDAPPRT